MSYRSVKRLLGETSLERKCRFLFGGGLMLLITGSFYVYAQLNLNVFEDQNRERARLLVKPSLLAAHAKYAGFQKAFAPLYEKPITESSDEVISGYTYELLMADFENAGAGRRPANEAGYEAIRELKKQHAAGAELLEHVSIDKKLKRYRFYQGLVAQESCVQCHRERDFDTGAKEGDLIAIAQIEFPLSAATRRIDKNNAILIALALVTVALAMAAAYVIVRYVIVKPVLHLRDVSDAIAHGELEQRADIRTGDEFEELSHAFNRMLRHLVTMQDELRHVNSNLDKKVDELAQANLSLHEMNKLKGEFLATMSHELRTPLNSILGFSDVLAGADNITDKQQKFLKNIESSGQNLLTLINDILDLAKIEAGKLEVHIVDFDVAELVERLVSNIRPLAERKNIELKWDVDDKLPFAQQDAGKLEQILYNLLSNAVKFTPEGGRVQVQALLENTDQLTIVVADTGIGIPLDDQANIFEKFRQGTVAPGEDSQALTREYDGTGLGLSIVKELSRLLEGGVFLESEFGKGSTFTIRIPLLLQPSLDDHEESLEHRTAEFNRQRLEEAASSSHP